MDDLRLAAVRGPADGEDVEAGRVAEQAVPLQEGEGRVRSACAAWSSSTEPAGPVAVSDLRSSGPRRRRPCGRRGRRGRVRRAAAYDVAGEDAEAVPRKEAGRGPLGAGAEPAAPPRASGSSRIDTSVSSSEIPVSQSEDTKTVRDALSAPVFVCDSARSADKPFTPPRPRPWPFAPFLAATPWGCRWRLGSPGPTLPCARGGGSPCRRGRAGSTAWPGGRRPVRFTSILAIFGELQREDRARRPRPGRCGGR